MQRSRAGGRALLGGSLAALVVGISAPACASAVAPTPVPGPPTAGGPPIGLDVGPIHVDLDLPLQLGGLLGGAAPASPAAPPGNAPTSSGAPSAPTRPSNPRTIAASPPPSARRSSAALPARTPPAAATARVTTTVLATKAATPEKRHRAAAAPSLLQSAFQPGNPVMLLGSVVLACALGVGGVVMMAGRGRRTPPPARHSR